MYLAHNITASQGGQIFGLFEEYEDAKTCLKENTRFSEFGTDWGHFVRVYHPNTIMHNGVWGLPRLDE